MRLSIAASTVLLACAASATAAPYETVIVYSKTGPQPSTLEVTLEDIMTGAHDNIVVPTQFTTDDGASYTMSAIKEQLDTDGVDAHYLTPFWDFSVSVAVDNKPLRKLDARLSATASEAQWQLPELTAGSRLATHFVDLDIRGSYSAEYLCGLEQVQRAKGDTAVAKSLAGLKLTRAGDELPSQAILTKAKEPILFSFCDAVTNAGSLTHTVDWAKVLAQVPTHHELAFGRSYATPEALREAHKLALLEVLFGDKLGTPELDVLPVNVPGFDAPVTNLVIHEHVAFTIASVASLHAKEEASSLLFGSNVKDLSRFLDKDSRVTIDLSEFNSLCGMFFSAPYSVVLTTTDEGAGTATGTSKPNPNAVVIKPPLSGACTAEVDAQWPQFLGRTFRIALVYQLPGSLGKVTVASTGPFKVRQLGLITTFPVVSEVVATIKGNDAGMLTSTSSIPISWAIRTRDRSGKYTAITIPWKIAWAARTDTDTSKLFAFYPHVSIIIPVDNPTEKTQYAIGVGVSIGEAFHFAWGVTTSDHSNFILIGLSPTDIVKLIK